MSAERHSLKRWFVAGALVLGAHAGVAAALGSWRSSEDSAGGPQNAVLIDMVAFAPDSQAAVAQAEPEVERETEPDEPEPERLPEPEPEPVPEPEPEPVPEPEPETEPAPEEIEPDPIPELPEPDREHDPVPKPEPVPDEPELVEETSRPQQLAAAHKPVRQPQEAVGHAGDVVTWQARLARHLERHKRYPRAARRRYEEGTASVRFTMNRAGNVQGCSLVHSSGYESLDSAACELVLSAQPLPPPPDDVPGTSLDMTVPVDYSLR